MWRKCFCFPHWNTCSWSLCGPVSSPSRRNLRESRERDWAQAPWRGKDAHSSPTSSSTTLPSSSHVRTANAWGSLPELLIHRNHKRCNTFVVVYAIVWGDTLGSSTDWNRNLFFEVGYYWNKNLKTSATGFGSGRWEECGRLLRQILVKDWRALWKGIRRA